MKNKDLDKGFTAFRPRLCYSLDKMKAKVLFHQELQYKPKLLLSLKKTKIPLQLIQETTAHGQQKELKFCTQCKTKALLKFCFGAIYPGTCNTWSTT